MMKRRIKCIRTKPYTKAYYLHQQLARFVQSLDHTPDLSEIRSGQRKPAPMSLTEMVF
ncbi:hypothetical protein [Pedobacter sp. Bi36]|uniref:hypothetical protein n=1 Tax=Pedobacter sp. Bi36 TaxID=2822352 RepID=UPI001E60F8DD|nr:hypothetical protein [Pedobacter sp. Bi36]